MSSNRPDSPAAAAAPAASAAAGGRIRAIVFDFDGVILESADVKTEAFLELYREHGPELVAKVREHHLANLGISRFKKFAWIAEHLFGRAIAEDESKALGERFSALALQKVLAAPMVPGAQAALEALEGKLPMFVASGTPQGELDLIVDQRGLRRFFREVWGTPTEKPAIVRDLLARYALQPTEVLFIGDGLSDHKAASETGLHFLARSTAELRAEWEKLAVRKSDDLSSLVASIEAW